MNKSIIGSLLLLATLTSVHADEAKGEFFIMGGQDKVSSSVYKNRSNSEGGLGYGFSKYWDNGVLAGFSIYGAGGSNSDVFGGFDARLGYSYANTGIYVIGSALAQSLGGTDVNGNGATTAYGFGGGGGIEYRWEKFTIAAEYKTYSMTPETLPTKYTLDTTNILLKYRF